MDAPQCPFCGLYLKLAFGGYWSCSEDSNNHLFEGPNDDHDGSKVRAQIDAMERRVSSDHAAALAAKDAEIERLKKDNSGLHEVQDEQRGIITSLRAELATAKARIAELEDNSLESLSTSDQVLVADMQRRLDETRAELATARAEAQRNADAAEALAGLERLGRNYAPSFNKINLSRRRARG